VSLLIRTFLSEANIGGLIFAAGQSGLLYSDKSHGLETDGSSKRDRPSLIIYAPRLWTKHPIVFLAQTVGVVIVILEVTSPGAETSMRCYLGAVVWLDLHYPNLLLLDRIPTPESIATLYS